MEKPRILAFNGSMGVGKSEAIKFIRHALAGTPVFLVKFAQPLYDMQEYVYGRINSVYKRPPDFVKDRKLLQWLGTEWGRDSVSKSLWVDLWKAKVEAFLASNPEAIVVCDDCRFDNEGEAIVSLNGAIIKIESNQNLSRITTSNGISNHSSEKGIDKQYICMLIQNNGTIEDYHSQLKGMLQHLGY